MTLTIGSLFSGIGGLELGLERAGLGPVLWQCELDPFCRAVLAKHWPNVTRFEDVTSKRSYPHVDLICGGFPCQDVSSAGGRRGLGGERSSLWWYFASVVRQVSPQFVVVENVTSGKALWLPTVRRALHVLGYDTEAMGIAARDVGALHRRERVFVLANARRDYLRKQHRRLGRPDRTSETIALGDGCSWHVADSSSKRRSRDARRLSGAEGSRSAECGWWSAEPDVGRVAHGVSGGMDGRKRRARLRALGNAVVPQCAEVIGRIVADLCDTDRWAGKWAGSQNWRFDE